MTTQEIAAELTHIKAREEHLKCRYEVLEGKLNGSIDYSKPKVKSSTSDRHTMLMAVMADVKIELDQLADRRELLREELMHRAHEADLTLDEMQVVRLRYIYDADWKTISDCMYWSPRYIYSLHRKALDKMADETN